MFDFRKAISGGILSVFCCSSDDLLWSDQTWPARLTFGANPIGAKSKIAALK